jgi:3-dehydroquinate synthase
MVAQQPKSNNSTEKLPDHEPRTLLVPLGDASYPIRIGTDWLGALGHHVQEIAKDISHAMVISDASVASTFGEEIRHGLAELGIRTDLYIVPMGETSKSSVQLLRLWDWMLEHRADRRSVILAVGGGVAGDLAGFAAATYQRGIRLVQVPTTLLSQVDSSVGGKTGINLAGGKNMVGAFWQPILVAIDTDTLNSLPPREYLSGFAEVIKYGVIQRPDLFAWLEQNAAKLVARDAQAMTHAISESCLTKAEVVGEDERETSGRRAILNYGHTFAHAIEATAGYGKFLHGEAVAIGMQMAAKFAANRGMLETPLLERQTSLLRAFRLPVSWDGADPKAMFEVMRSDKKNEHGTLKLVLPTELGSVQMIDNATEEEVIQAIRYCQYDPEFDDVA